MRDLLLDKKSYFFIYFSSGHYSLIAFTVELHVDIFIIYMRTYHHPRENINDVKGSLDNT